MHTKFSMQPGDGERSKRPKGKGWVPGIGDHPHPHAKALGLLWPELRVPTTASAQGEGRLTKETGPSALQELGVWTAKDQPNPGEGRGLPRGINSTVKKHPRFGVSHEKTTCMVSPKGRQGPVHLGL